MKAFVALTVSVVLTWCAHPASADIVRPTAAVTNGVVVRQEASSDSAQIGSLLPGDRAELLDSVPSWHRVRLTNGTVGFVSKRWTRVIETATGPAPGEPTPPISTTGFTLDAVDVGTGLAVVVQAADFTLVYDGGSNDDLGRGADNRLVAFLKHEAPTLTTIDHLIVSHPHRDHVELLADVLAQYSVRNVWDSGAVNDICGYRAFLTNVRDEPGASYHCGLDEGGTHSAAFKAKACYGDSLPDETVQLPAALIDGNPVTLGQGASMRFLYVDGSDHGTKYNENSLVTRLDVGGVRILLVGDAEAGGRHAPTDTPDATSIEGKLLACCTPELKADLLVVGHHGSKTSSRTAFLDAVGAKMFIVSSGPTKYGGTNGVVLPDQEVIDELESRGDVFRTDVDDVACGQNPAKIGGDADGRAGGCDNIHVTGHGAGHFTIEDRREAD